MSKQDKVLSLDWALLSNWQSALGYNVPCSHVLTNRFVGVRGACLNFFHNDVNKRYEFYQDALTFVLLVVEFIDNKSSFVFVCSAARIIQYNVMAKSIEKILPLIALLKLEN